MMDREITAGARECRSTARLYWFSAVAVLVVNLLLGGIGVADGLIAGFFVGMGWIWRDGAREWEAMR